MGAGASFDLMKIVRPMRMAACMTPRKAKCTRLLGPSYGGTCNVLSPFQYYVRGKPASTHPLCASYVEESSGIRCRRRAFARLGHRREHRALHLGRSGPTPL